MREKQLNDSSRKTNYYGMQEHIKGLRGYFLVHFHVMEIEKPLPTNINDLLAQAYKDLSDSLFNEMAELAIPLHQTINTTSGLNTCIYEKNLPPYTRSAITGAPLLLAQ